MGCATSVGSPTDANSRSHGVRGTEKNKKNSRKTRKKTDGLDDLAPVVSYGTNRNDDSDDGGEAQGFPNSFDIDRPMHTRRRKRHSPSSKHRIDTPGESTGGGQQPTSRRQRSASSSANTGTSSINSSPPTHPHVPISSTTAPDMNRIPRVDSEDWYEDGDGPALGTSSDSSDESDDEEEDDGDVVRFPPEAVSIGSSSSSPSNSSSPSSRNRNDHSRSLAAERLLRQFSQGGSGGVLAHRSSISLSSSGNSSGADHRVAVAGGGAPSCETASTFKRSASGSKRPSQFHLHEGHHDHILGPNRNLGNSGREHTLPAMLSPTAPHRQQQRFLPLEGSSQNDATSSSSNSRESPGSNTSSNESSDRPMSLAQHRRQSALQREAAQLSRKKSTGSSLMERLGSPGSPRQQLNRSGSSSGIFPVLPGSPKGDAGGASPSHLNLMGGRQHRTILGVSIGSSDSPNSRQRHEDDTGSPTDPRHRSPKPPTDESGGRRARLHSPEGVRSVASCGSTSSNENENNDDGGQPSLLRNLFSPAPPPGATTDNGPTSPRRQGAQSPVLLGSPRGSQKPVRDSSSPSSPFKRMPTSRSAALSARSALILRQNSAQFSVGSPKSTPRSSLDSDNRACSSMNVSTSSMDSGSLSCGGEDPGVRSASREFSVVFGEGEDGDDNPILKEIYALETVFDHAHEDAFDYPL